MGFSAYVLIEHAKNVATVLCREVWCKSQGTQTTNHRQHIPLRATNVPLRSSGFDISCVLFSFWQRGIPRTCAKECVSRDVRTSKRHEPYPLSPNSWHPLRPQCSIGVISRIHSLHFGKRMDIFLTLFLRIVLARSGLIEVGAASCPLFTVLQPLFSIVLRV
jgi:hypothetical protein